MSKESLTEMERKMQSTLDALRHDLSSLRTGRASPNLLDKIVVDYYGTATPLSQIAAISVPEPRQLLVAPWEKTLVDAIVGAISKSDLGVQPIKDGDKVRISLPALNEERRKEMVKIAGKKTEDHKVALRNVRRETNDHLKKLEKDGELSKDDLKRAEDDVQKLTDRYVAETDTIRADKEAEIMEV
ncbi:MAG: ribosome recycling factor [Abditibacteriaceae bacterium]